MTRRTLLFLPAVRAASPLALGQYVLPAQRPPAGRFPPSPSLAAEIRRKVSELEEGLAALRRKNVADPLLVEVEIFHKAAVWIDRHNEYFLENAAAQTLALLDVGLARARELAGGTASWTTATGPVIRAYRSRVEGSAQPYLAHVPASYDGRRPARLDVILHGANRTMAEVQFMSRALAGVTPAGPGLPPPETLQVEVFGRTNNAYRWAGETDVLEVVDAARRNYAVDENRVVLRGFSMGGAGAWHLGLQHPDRWAAVEAGAGFTDTIEYARLPNLPGYQLPALHIYDARDYALNLCHLPTVGYAGEDDPQGAAQRNIRDQLEKQGFRFQTDGLNRTSAELPLIFLVGPKTAHRWEPESRKRSEAFIRKALHSGRTEPDHVRFVTYTTRYHKCFWVTVDGLERHYERAEVDARRSGAGEPVEVKTKNVSVLALTTRGAGKVVIDGQRFAVEKRGEWRFQKRGGVWSAGDDKKLRKRHGLQGPIDDAFLDSFLCVRPTRRAAHVLAGRYAEETLGTFESDFSKYLRGQIRIKDDTALADGDSAGHHLILFGDPESNQVLRRVAGGLPLKWSGESLFLGGRSYDAATHTVVMIYPNPLHPSRYVVLNTGHSFGANEWAATNASLFPRFGDYAVLRLRQPVGRRVESEVVTAGYFDENWQLPRG